MASELITVAVPRGFEAERSYALSLLLEHVMGLTVSYVTGAPDWYELKLPSGRRLRMWDDYFGRVNEKHRCTQAEYLPGALTVLSKALGPVPYGREGVSEDYEVITLEADLVGSTFLLATGWEEEVLAESAASLDAHGRVKPELTWQGRLHLTDRPLVHEWAEVLLGLLRKLGLNDYTRPDRPSVLPTHDIDEPAFYTSGLKRSAVTLLRPLGAWQKFVAGPPNPFSKTNEVDPYYTYEQLMRAAEAVGSQAVFFFSGNRLRGAHDKPYNVGTKKMRRLIEQIKARGHRIGLHPSYRSADEPLRMREELLALERVAGPVEWVRPHYLRGTVQQVWLRAAALGLSHSSSAGYADRLGFRTGLCIAYPAFSTYLRQPLALTEWPLVAMEVAPFTRRPEQGAPSLTPDALQSAFATIQHRVRRSGGTFAFDWHNSTLATPAWSPYAGVWEGCYRSPNA